MTTNNSQIVNEIAGQFLTATHNFMAWNKKINPFHLEPIRNQYCDAIVELIPFCFSINNIEINK